MRLYLFFIILLTLILFSTHQIAETPISTPSISLQWPIQTERIELRITSVFGESRGDHFHNGVDIASASEPVYPVAKGRILFSRFQEDNPFENEGGPGNFIWMQHEGDLLSAYYHLSSSAKNLDTEITLQTKIATTGNTGHSAGAHLHFIVSKNSGREFINPVNLLPEISDHEPPVIGFPILFINENYTEIHDFENINLSKNFPMAIDIFDPGEKKGQRRGIHALAISLNGISIKDIKIGSIKLHKGEWVNGEGVPFHEVYYRNRYLIGSPGLKSGENILEFSAADFKGNTSVKSVTFYVNRISTN